MKESENEIFDREWDKMLSGEIYDAMHPKFIEMLGTTREKLWEFNNLRPSEMDKMKGILREILGGYGEKFHVRRSEGCIKGYSGSYTGSL